MCNALCIEFIDIPENLECVQMPIEEIEKKEADLLFTRFLLFIQNSFNSFY